MTRRAAKGPTAAPAEPGTSDPPLSVDASMTSVASTPSDRRSSLETKVPVRLCHFSDTHLAFQEYAALTPNGDNLRATDIVKAFANVAKQIVEEDPPLVIHSGDVTDRPKVDIRYLILLQQWLERLAAVRPDGTRRQLVVISGNHDQPRHHRELCSLELFRSMPGVHVVTTRYHQVRFEPADGAAPELATVIVHALPHDQLKFVDFDVVRPVEGMHNVLVAHGVAGGSELFRRSLGREYAIPTDVLSRDWDYVALGHFHKRGPVPLVSVSTTSKKTAEAGRAWYAGSTENMGFRDLRDGGAARGYLSVTLRPGQLPDVRPRDLPIRTMKRLPVVDATGLTPDEITALLVERIRTGDVGGAVVGQIVTGVTRELWSLVDQAPAREAAASAVHYAVTPQFTTPELVPSTSPSGASVLGDLASVLEAAAQEQLAEKDREPALALARRLLGSALNEIAPADPEAGSDEEVRTEGQGAEAVGPEDPRLDGPDAEELDATRREVA